MQSSSHKYIARLDHLRFIAAVLVIFWHVFRFAKVPTAFVSPIWPISLLQEGHTGVALFMTLSGYIFWYLSKGNNVSYLMFIRNRILRIAPLFLLWMFFFFYLGGVDPLKFVVAVFSLLNEKGEAVPDNGWAVIVEFQFYFLFPVLLSFQRKMGTRYLILLVGLFITFRLVAWAGFGSVFFLAYSTIFGRMDQFLFGMIVCELAGTREKWLRHPLILVGLLLAWSLVMYAFDLGGGYFDWPGGYPSVGVIWVFWPTVEGVFYGLIIAAYLAAEISVPTWIDKGLAWLGTLSFSMYLGHAAIIIALGKYLGPIIPHFAGLSGAGAFCVFIVMPATIALSTLTYYLIERPFLRMRSPYLTPIRA